MRRPYLMADSTAGRSLSASIPGHGSFTVTGDALAMIEVFGGLLHCYQGPGGCRKQGLYFSRTEPKKPIRCLLGDPERFGGGSRDGWIQAGGEEIVVSVSHELAPKLGGAVLDFGSYNKMQRFVWLSLPAVKGPACTCRRSFGAPAGRRSPCLDDQGLGLNDL
ncbi:peptidase [Paeniglutamicibacter sp. ZC-3]|uniref:peptidase n=1 Tax=Paeniglutamicibacter sp. ZC-3 TaxID=2986919 RepID=UPI0021F7612A|nr:peptidase [Paeniglutamicibacter sp. ZC-3]MCV9996209.1 peptidase [Paeniglutamicibacter sp. ZC-3]